MGRELDPDLNLGESDRFGKGRLGTVGESITKGVPMPIPAYPTEVPVGLRCMKDQWGNPLVWGWQPHLGCWKVVAWPQREEPPLWDLPVS